MKLRNTNAPCKSGLLRRFSAVKEAGHWMASMLPAANQILCQMEPTDIVQQTCQAVPREPQHL